MQTTSRNSETTRCRLCCEKLGTSHDVKGLAIGSVLDHIVVERAMMTSVKKNIKNAGLVWSISNKVFPENNHKIGLFWPIDFRLSLPPKIAAKSVDFSVNLPLKIPRNLTFFSTTYQKPCRVWCDPSDLKILWIEVGINLEVNWLCLCDLAHFYDESKGG